MKKQEARMRGLAIVAGLCLMMAMPVVSAVDRRSSDVTYSALGLSRVTADFDNVGSAISLDSVLGFRVPGVQWFGLELNLGFTIIPGETTPCGGLGPACGPNDTRGTQDFQAVNVGVYTVFRTPGRLYGAGKIGYRYINSNLPELDEDRSGTGWGAGLGYRYNPDRGGAVELMYTRMSGDLDTLGLLFGFSFGGI
jgi:hypothetical protein